MYSVVTTNDEQPEGWCEVICVIPELKVKKSFAGGKFTDKPAVGNFDHQFENRFDYLVSNSFICCFLGLTFYTRMH